MRKRLYCPAPCPSHSINGQRTPCTATVEIGSSFGLVIAFYHISKAPTKPLGNHTVAKTGIMGFTRQRLSHNDLVTNRRRWAVILDHDHVIFVGDYHQCEEWLDYHEMVETTSGSQSPAQPLDPVTKAFGHFRRLVQVAADRCQTQQIELSRKTTSFASPKPPVESSCRFPGGSGACSPDVKLIDLFCSCDFEGDALAPYNLGSVSFRSGISRTKWTIQLQTDAVHSRRNQFAKTLCRARFSCSGRLGKPTCTSRHSPKRPGRLSTRSCYSASNHSGCSFNISSLNEWGSAPASRTTYRFFCRRARPPYFNGRIVG